MSGIDCSVIESQPFSMTCIFAYSMTIILPIMLALCLMLSGTYYAQNYASIIGWCLTTSNTNNKDLIFSQPPTVYKDSPHLLYVVVIAHVQLHGVETGWARCLAVITFLTM